MYKTCSRYKIAQMQQQCGINHLNISNMNNLNTKEFDGIKNEHYKFLMASNSHALSRMALHTQTAKTPICKTTILLRSSVNCNFLSLSTFIKCHLLCLVLTIPDRLFIAINIKFSILKSTIKTIVFDKSIIRYILYFYDCYRFLQKI